MEIAKQELIVHAREAASRVLSELGGKCGCRPPLCPWDPVGSSWLPLAPTTDRQMSEQMASDARKREQFQRLKEQFVKDQEVGVPSLQVLDQRVGGSSPTPGFRLLKSHLANDCLLGSDAWRPDKKNWKMTSAMPVRSGTGRSD